MLSTLYPVCGALSLPYLWRPRCCPNTNIGYSHKVNIHYLAQLLSSGQSILSHSFNRASQADSEGLGLGVMRVGVRLSLSAENFILNVVNIKLFTFENIIMEGTLSRDCCLCLNSNFIKKKKKKKGNFL